MYAVRWQLALLSSAGKALPLRAGFARTTVAPGAFAGEEGKGAIKGVQKLGSETHVGRLPNGLK